jgi:hypothetical protein
MNATDKRNIEYALKLKDQEINRLTAKCELYRQVKNWTIILSISIITLIIIL